MRVSKEKREALKKLPYRQYLKSDFWKTVRELAIARSANACQLCNSKGVLHVHHRTYQNRGYEDQNIHDLVALCSSCHQRFHQIKPKSKKAPKKTSRVTLKTTPKVRKPRLKAGA